MAAWGPELYQDDIAEDVREIYKEQLKSRKSNEEATSILINIYQDEINDIDDAPVFWFALADTQYKLKKLLPIVKENALNWIREGTDLNRWEQEDPKGAKIRKKVLEDLRNKLESFD